MKDEACGSRLWRPVSNIVMCSGELLQGGHKAPLSRGSRNQGGQDDSQGLLSIRVIGPVAYVRAYFIMCWLQAAVLEVAGDGWKLAFKACETACCHHPSSHKVSKKIISEVTVYLP